jgi:hypothetical protein
MSRFSCSTCSKKIRRGHRGECGGGRNCHLPPGGRGDSKVGDSFTLTFVAPNQLIRSPWIPDGNPYLCNAKTPAEYKSRCGT